MRYLLNNFDNGIAVDGFQSEGVIFALELPRTPQQEWACPAQVVAWAKATGLPHDQRDYVVITALLVFAGVEKHSEEATALLFDVLTSSPLSSRQVQQITEELIDGERWDPHGLLDVLNKQKHDCVVFRPVIAALVHHITLDHLGPRPPAWTSNLFTVVGILIQADSMSEHNATILRDLETIARWSRNDDIRQHAFHLYPQH